MRSIDYEIGKKSKAISSTFGRHIRGDGTKYFLVLIDFLLQMGSRHTQELNWIIVFAEKAEKTWSVASNFSTTEDFLLNEVLNKFSFGK